MKVKGSDVASPSDAAKVGVFHCEKCEFSQAMPLPFVSMSQ